MVGSWGEVNCSDSMNLRSKHNIDAHADHVTHLFSAGICGARL